jgi:hypothetical protein
MGAANFFIGSRLRRVLTSATVSIDDQNGLNGRTVGKFKALAAAGGASCLVRQRR